MPRTIREPARSIPVLGAYDVVVIGGGPAGIGAAVAAARMKAKTLLVEMSGCLGGMGTGGMVPVFAPYSRSGPPLIRGIGWEIIERLRARNALGRSHDQTYGWIAKDTEKLKLVLDEMVTQAGAEVLFFTLFGDVIRAGRRVKAVILQTKSGRVAVLANTFIDATGDADVAAAAGVKFDKGDDDGHMQATSLCHTVAGVDIPRYRAYIDSVGPIQDWLASLEGKKLLPRLPHCEYRGVHGAQVGPDTLTFNFGHLYGVDGTDARQLSRAMMNGRRMVNAYVDFARANVPGMERAHLVGTAELLGVRETRRIRGRTTMTGQDVLSCAHRDEDIASYDYPVDSHNVKRSKKLFQKFVTTMDATDLPKGKSYGIPFGAIVPKGLDNLLAPGRALSADRTAQACARVMPACIAMGEAAGTAAAMAARKNIAVADVDVQSLRKELRRRGANV